MDLVGKTFVIDAEWGGTYKIIEVLKVFKNGKVSVRAINQDFGKSSKPSVFNIRPARCSC